MMKFLWNFIAFLAVSGEGLSVTDKDVCENSCYLVLEQKSFLYKDKFNSSLNLLTTIEDELKFKETFFVRDEMFDTTLSDLNDKIDIMIHEIETPIDLEGNRTLFNIINEYSKNLEETEDFLKETKIYVAEMTKFENRAFDEFDKVTVNLKEMHEKLKILDTAIEEAIAEHQKAAARLEKIDKEHEELQEVTKEMTTMEPEFELQVKEYNETISKKHENITELSKIVNTTLDIQKQISIELSENIEAIWSKTYEEYESISKISGESSSKAREIYEASLDLFVKINFVEMSVNLEEIDRMIKNFSIEEERILKEFDDYLKNNEEPFDSYLKNVNLGEQYLERGVKVKAELLKIQNEFIELNKIASTAFKEGSATIDEAKDTFNRLIYFQENNERTSEMERFALEKVPKIRHKIKEAQEIVAKVQTGFQSAMISAEEARKKALEVKTDLDDLAREAKQLQHRAKITKAAMETVKMDIIDLEVSVDSNSEQSEKIEKILEDDESIISEAKIKVDQSEFNINNTQKEINLVLKKILKIQEEIESYKVLEVETMDRLETQLVEAEKELEQINLDFRMDELRKVWVEMEGQIEIYRNELPQLEEEATRLKFVSESIDNGCYRRARLEVV